MSEVHDMISSNKEKAQAAIDAVNDPTKSVEELRKHVQETIAKSIKKAKVIAKDGKVHTHDRVHFTSTLCVVIHCKDLPVPELAFTDSIHGSERIVRAMERMGRRCEVVPVEFDEE